MFPAPFGHKWKYIFSIFHLRFFQYMNGVHVVLHGIDNDQHVSKLSRDDPSAVISAMLRPNDVDLVISQVPELEAGKLTDKRREQFQMKENTVNDRTQRCQI